MTNPTPLDTQEAPVADADPQEATVAENLAEAPASVIRFTSTPLVHAPGYIAFMRRVDRLKPDEARTAYALFMFAGSYPNAPAWALLALAEGRYRIEGDAVVVEPEASAPDAEGVAGGEA